MDELTDNIFNNDPVYMKSLIGKKVNVEVTEVGNIIGKIYVVDPIFKTIVLHKSLDSTMKIETVFVLYHAVKSLHVLSEEADVEYLRSREPDIEMQQEDIAVRKQKLKKWLIHRYLNVEESGDYLKIDNHLIIMPPYGTNNCVCNNTLVLERVQNIIDLMPDDFSS